MGSPSTVCGVGQLADAADAAVGLALVAATASHAGIGTN